MSKKSNKFETQRLLNRFSSELTFKQRYNLQKKVNYGTSVGKFTKSLNAMLAVNKRNFYKTEAGIEYINQQLDYTVLKNDYLSNMKWLRKLYAAKKAIAHKKGDIVGETHFKGKMEDAESRIRTKQDMYLSKSKKSSYQENESTPAGDVTDYINTFATSVLKKNDNDYVKTFQQLLKDGTLQPLAQNKSGYIYGYRDSQANITSPIEEPYLAVAYKEAK